MYGRSILREIEQLGQQLVCINRTDTTRLIGVTNTYLETPRVAAMPRVLKNS